MIYLSSQNFVKLLLIIMFLTFARFMYLWEGNFHLLLIIDKVLFAIGSISFFLFWFLMLKHFFENKSIKNRALWGFSLFFLSWLAAITYFFLYYLKK